MEDWTVRTISIMNQKGGCGKTTVAINLASALADLERRVLLIDLDPQAHSTVGLGINPSEARLTTYEVLMDPALPLSDGTHWLNEYLNLVPSSTVLSGVEQELADRLGREERLSGKLAQVGDDTYDFVIIDCPPSVGLLTFNALVAASEVLIPVDASFFSMHGLVKLRETIEVIEEELNRRLMVHVVCNNLDTRTQFSKELLGEVERFHTGVLLDTFISHTVRLKEAAAKGMSVIDLDRRCKATRQFLSLGRELIEKQPKVQVENIAEWMEKLHGPQRINEGVLFTLDSPRATNVSVTGEFTNWSREGVPMAQDDEDGFWKIVLDIQPGEYEYRYIVDGVWIRDPSNRDFVRNEFGQENSLLIV